MKEKREKKKKKEKKKETLAYSPKKYDLESDSDFKKRF